MEPVRVPEPGEFNSDEWYIAQGYVRNRHGKLVHPYAVI